MHSNLRTTALVLFALIPQRPAHAAVSKLVQYLLVGPRRIRFRNTQEAAWAFLALWDYARIHEAEAARFKADLMRPSESEMPFPWRKSLWE